MKTIILFFILILTATIFPQITYDTVSVKNVGPGVRHIEVNASTPWTIDILEIDITNPFLKIETVKSNDKLQAGREKTSSMSQRINSVGHWSVGGINGDFFDLGTGRPNNTQIVKGEVLRREHGVLPSVSFDFNNKMILENHVYSAKVIKGGNSIDADDINAARGNDNLILYNSFYSNTTGTNNSGTEIIITPLNGWRANDTLICIVDSVAVNKGNHTLNVGKMVISASGSKAAFFNTLIKNDTIKLIQNLLPGLPKLTASIGGHPYVVKNGAVHNFDLNDPFVTARHPRTAVGMNIDTTKYFFITVDGRQASSLGMNLTELANFMIMIGCYQGINLDGGGSTTMVVRNQVVNSPSDAEGERVVANALFVVSTAPIGSIHYLNINPTNNKIFIGKQIQFTVTGQDQYFNPVTLNPNLVQFSLSNSNFGTINSQGIFTAGTNHDSGYVIATYNNTIKDSVFVVVKGISSFKVTPAYAVVDNTQFIAFKVKVHDTDGEEQQIASNLINWTSTNTSVGTIDLAGQFQGLTSGTTYVIGNYIGIKDTATVNVQIGYGVNVIDSIESLNNYSFDWQNIDSTYSNIILTDSVATAGEYSIKLDYRFIYTTGMFNWVFLRTNLPLYGVPDSLMIDFLSDGANHRVFFDLEDYEGRVYRVFTHKLANNNGVFETLRAALPRSNVNYPLILKSITIPLGSTQINGNVYSGKVFIDRLRVKYPAVSTMKNEELIVNNFSLSQNYPNPFNPLTKIEFSLPSLLKGEGSGVRFVSLKVYDVLGNEVATLVDEFKSAGNYSVSFDGSKLSSGIYYYTLRAGDFVSVKKMILMK